MSQRSHTIASILAFAVLFVLHHDFWRDDSAGARLLFGWMPGELAYRLAWMVLAFLYLLHLTTCVWREESE